MKITLPSIPPGEYRVTHDPDKFDSSLDELYVLTGQPHEAITLATVNVRPFAPHLAEPLALADCIAALPDLLAALADALEKAPRCNPQHPDLLTDAERCPETHPYCCGACAHFYRIRTALTKAGCTIQP